MKKVQQISLFYIQSYSVMRRLRVDKWNNVGVHLGDNLVDQEMLNTMTFHKIMLEIQRLGKHNEIN